LDQLYDYLFHRLIQANVKKDPEIMTEVRDHLRDLRDTWKEAMKLAKKDKPAYNTSVGVGG